MKLSLDSKQTFFKVYPLYLTKLNIKRLDYVFQTKIDLDD